MNFNVFVVQSNLLRFWRCWEAFSTASRCSRTARVPLGQHAIVTFKPLQDQWINDDKSMDEWVPKDEKTFSKLLHCWAEHVFFKQNVAIAAFASWCITLWSRVKIALHIDPDCWKVLPQTLQSKWKDLIFFSRSERMAKEWFALPCYWNVCFFCKCGFRMFSIFTSSCCEHA